MDTVQLSVSTVETKRYQQHFDKFANDLSPLQFLTWINISRNQTINYLEISDFGVTKFTSSVVAELNIPLTRQVVHKIRVLLDDGIENVLVG
jgi:hypothetical protein